MHPPPYGGSGQGDNLLHLEQLMNRWTSVLTEFVASSGNPYIGNISGSRPTVVFDVSSIKLWTESSTPDSNSSGWPTKIKYGSFLRIFGKTGRCNVGQPDGCSLSCFETEPLYFATTVVNCSIGEFFARPELVTSRSEVCRSSHDLNKSPLTIRSNLK